MCKGRPGTTQRDELIYHQVHPGETTPDGVTWQQTVNWIGNIGSWTKDVDPSNSDGRVPDA